MLEAEQWLANVRRAPLPQSRLYVVREQPLLVFARLVAHISVHRQPITLENEVLVAREMQNQDLADRPRCLTHLHPLSLRHPVQPVVINRHYLQQHRLL